MADKPIQKVTYDPAANAAYIYLTGSMAPGEAARTVAVGPYINLDFDSTGHLIGIELLSKDLLHPVLMARAVPAGPQNA